LVVKILLQGIQGTVVEELARVSLSEALPGVAVTPAWI